MVMAIGKLDSLLTSFTPDCDYLAISSPNGIKIWNTSSGSLLAAWKPSDNLSDASFTCMACSQVGKKRRKERAPFLLAIGTDTGEIVAIEAFSGEQKWKSTRCQPEGIASLSFANRGRILHLVGTNGMAYEMNSETGELLREFKVSKTPISSLASSSDERILAIASAKIRVFSLETEKELTKFSAKSAHVKYISMSDEAKAIVTSGSGNKHLQVWKCDLNTRTVSEGPVLSMKHSPILVECKNSCDGQDGLVVLSVSETGVAYVWNLNSFSHEHINPTKVTVKSNKDSTDLQSGRSARKSRSSIIAASLHALEAGGRVTILIIYGSIDSPQFNFVDINNPGEDIVVTVIDGAVETKTEAIQEDEGLAGKGLDEVELEAVAVPIQNRIANKKRAPADLDFPDAENSVDIGHGVPMEEVDIYDDLTEPTMGEKLASLNLVDNGENKILEKQESSQRAKPPSADSVHVLLKQALHADDRTLLLSCLYTQDEKVIVNSVSLLSPSYVLKLLDSLISIIQSRGASLVCALPWLRSLLLQHASGIMSQESSLLALNSLYQLIESRVSTFRPALQLSSSLDLLYAGTVDDGMDENDTITPVIFEDNDESDEQESEDAMETDQDDNDLETFSDASDLEGNDGMIQ